MAGKCCAGCAARITLNRTTKIRAWHLLVEVFEPFCFQASAWRKGFHKLSQVTNLVSHQHVSLISLLSLTGISCDTNFLNFLGSSTPVCFLYKKIFLGIKLMQKILMCMTRQKQTQWLLFLKKKMGKWQKGKKVYSNKSFYEYVNILRKYHFFQTIKMILQNFFH